MKTWSYIVFFLILVGCLFFGYRIYPKFNPCPTIESDTIYVIDTVIREIPNYVPYYVYRTDSVVYRDTVFKDVDTTEILRSFYATYYYTREFSDSLLYVQMHDAVSMNQIIDTKFNYRINRPQTVIENILNMAPLTRSVYAGLSLPIAEPKYTELEALFVYPRLYFGLGAGYRSASVKAGIKIFDF